MEKKKSDNDTVKWIVSLIVSVGFGRFIMTILENIEMNIWFARFTGALVSGIVLLFIYHLLIKNTENTENKII